MGPRSPRLMAALGGNSYRLSSILLGLPRTISWHPPKRGYHKYITSDPIQDRMGRQPRKVTAFWLSAHL